MRLFKIFSKRQKELNTPNEEAFKFSIKYNESFLCQPDKKQYLVLRGRVENNAARDVAMKVSISPRGRFVPSITKLGYNKRRKGVIIWSNRPQTIVSSTITDSPYILKASSKEDITLIIVDFNINDNMLLSILFEGKEQSIPIVLKDIQHKDNI